MQTKRKKACHQQDIVTNFLLNPHVIYTSEKFQVFSNMPALVFSMHLQADDDGLDRTITIPKQNSTNTWRK